MEINDLKKYRDKLSLLSEEANKLRDVYLKNGYGPITNYPSIDKPWLKYYDEELLTEEIPDKSIYQFAYDSVKEKDMLDEVALDIRTSMNGFEKFNTITYREFFDNVKNYAGSLDELGIKPNEIVPIIVPNIPEARYLIYSNNYVGSTTYPISLLLPERQLDKIINENDIKNVFVFDMLYDKYKNVLNNEKIKNIVYIGNGDLPKNRKIVPLSEFYNLNNNKDILPYYEKDHTAVIVGTSGTTGTSKGVCLSDSNVNYAALTHRNSGFDGTIMDALIPSISYGVAMLHFETSCGKYVYLIPELLTTKFPEALYKIKPDNFPGGPVHAINLANSKEFKEGNIPSIKNLISGGASLPKNIEEALNDVNEGYTEKEVNDRIISRQGFGLTENDGVTSYNMRGAYKFGSAGVPSMYSNVGIFDPKTGEELPYNEQGEICVTGKMVMQGYLNNKEETDHVIKVHSDGKRWIHTGDIGYIDETGHIYHVDRMKNIFMRTGFNVHPSKIAEFIDGLPYVKNAAVCGFEHPFEQMVPIAFIQMDNTDKSFEEIKEQIKEECYKELEETSVPYDFIEVDELPINAGGKVDFNIIKQKANIDLSKEDKYTKKLIFKNN